MKKTQRMFWNEHYRLHESGWRKFTIFLPDQQKLLKGKNVLELGAGNGKTIQGLLRAGAKKITAIDFSEIAVSFAEKKFVKEIEQGKLSVLHADATKLSFKNNSFDTVVCYHTLGAMFLRERKKCFKEVFRVLRKGGTLLFEDFAVGDLREKKKSLKEVEKKTLQKNNGVIQHFFDKKEVLGLIEWVGFETLELNQQKETLILGQIQVVRSEVKGIFLKKP